LLELRLPQLKKIKINKKFSRGLVRDPVARGSSFAAARPIEFVG